MLPSWWDPSVYERECRLEESRDVGEEVISTVSEEQAAARPGGEAATQTEGYMDGWRGVQAGAGRVLLASAESRQEMGWTGALCWVPCCCHF